MYQIIYGLLYFLSLFPLRILYWIADFIYILLYYVFGYRKKVVKENLAGAFPEKNDLDRRSIAKKFYRNLADSFVETIKLISASDQFIMSHFKGDYSLFHTLYEKGKKCQIHSGHHFNWEYANVALPLSIPYKLLTVYMPVQSAVFEKIFMRLRSKTGAIMLPATNMRAAILPHRNTIYALGLVADQNAGNPSSGWWIHFFGKPAPFVKAPESGARRGNIPLIFSHFVKERRGYYRIYFKLAEEEPASTLPGELTVRYVRFLEEVIRENPDMWLWSHRRWKWEWKEEYGAVLDDN